MLQNEEILFAAHRNSIILFAYTLYELIGRGNFFFRVLLLINVCPITYLFVQADKITKASFENCNLRPIEQIHLSDEIFTALDKCKEADIAKFRLNVRSHFVAIGEHIVAKTSYDNRIVKALKFIAPEYILEPQSSEEVIGVAKQLPFPIPSTALDEWNCIRAYVEVQKLQTWKGRIDDFWYIIFELKGLDELPRFPVVSKIIKCFLALTHGAGDVERGFSESGLIMTDDKTQMTARTLGLNYFIEIRLFWCQ